MAEKSATFVRSQKAWGVEVGVAAGAANIGFAASVNRGLAAEESWVTTCWAVAGCQIKKQPKMMTAIMNDLSADWIGPPEGI